MSAECKLTEASQRALDRLGALQPNGEWKALPKAKLASVLVLLYTNDQGDLSVLLTTRALTMRSHPGETALPGGRHEPGDEHIEATALREAKEEVGLQPKFKLRYLTTLAPLISRAFLFVVPCIYFLLSPTNEVLESLKPEPAEVHAIFSAPLRWFASTDTVQGAVYTFRDLDWVNNRPYRFNSLEHASFASPVTGMTFDVLRIVAALAFDGPLGNFTAKDQMTFAELVQLVLSGRS